MILFDKFDKYVSNDFRQIHMRRENSGLGWRGGWMKKGGGAKHKQTTRCLSGTVTPWPREGLRLGDGLSAVRKMQVRGEGDGASL